MNSDSTPSPMLFAVARPADVVGGIDEAMAGLADLDALPPEEHVARFDAVHAALAAALADVDRL
ncbi:hypothetical protein C1701_03990 [Actinoalloteichus sp. AHMU CJ021]|uniref:Uncharacterized protein n=1 Tax=Actinoalloteichus caeruleus DSM 43889 TaxID=1120930 RepID=A0ABT1JGM4_ACTCY|nr:hypothetical protein [Actinoalloteichus caeruleus]AUS77668.1 hypothetical protein C1701_03990 [Actinoalloteichus sp. AHMU CJ021]MCP2331578.1 hypothetical protein [Actinoalloteichus caeruleus DSM 43889]